VSDQLTKETRTYAQKVADGDYLAITLAEQIEEVGSWDYSPIGQAILSSLERLQALENPNG